MSNFLKRATRDGVCKGIGDAVGKAVREVVEPHATQFANKADQRFDQAAGNVAQEARKTASGLEGACANLERATQNYATQMSKNMKVCPGYGQPATAEKPSAPPAIPSSPRRPWRKVRYT